MMTDSTDNQTQARIKADDLFFDKKDLGVSANPLVNLVRNFFYKEKITNKDYLDRYLNYYRNTQPQWQRDVIIQKAAADRKFIRAVDKITFNMARNVLNVMGFSVHEVQIVIVDDKNGQVQTVTS